MTPHQREQELWREAGIFDGQPSGPPSPADPARPLEGHERWAYPLTCIGGLVAILAMLFFGSRS